MCNTSSVRTISSLICDDTRIMNSNHHIDSEDSVNEEEDPGCEIYLSQNLFLAKLTRAFLTFTLIPSRPNVVSEVLFDLKELIKRWILDLDTKKMCVISRRLSSGAYEMLDKSSIALDTGYEGVRCFYTPHFWCIRNAG